MQSSTIGRAAWHLIEYPEAVSTNDLARECPPWTAVRADAQSGGRGRYGRAFVSDPGGLWLSAVLPADGGARKWAGFSLMVGVHLLEMLEGLGVRSARLRWPNDLMCGTKKLAGLLIEQSSAGSLIVGFGLNNTNRPWERDPALGPIATSMSAVAPSTPAVRDLAILTLDALADAHAAMERGGMALAIGKLNARWEEPRPVELDLAGGHLLTGHFSGLDSDGNLRIIAPSGEMIVVEHQSVEKLREIL